jgi:competence protein ComGC
VCAVWWDLFLVVFFDLVLFMIGPAGIGGLILGIIAVIQINWNPRLQGKGRAVVGIVTSLVSILLLLSIMVPAVATERELAKQLQCGSQLSDIGKAMTIYRENHQNSLPAELSDLVREADLDPKCLLCPSTDDQLESCSYVYRGVDLNSRSNPELVLAYDKPENHHQRVQNILFADGWVKKVTLEDFEKVIARDNKIRRDSGLSQKSIDPEPQPQSRKGGE